MGGVGCGWGDDHYGVCEYLVGERVSYRDDACISLICGLLDLDGVYSSVVHCQASSG